MKIEIRAADRSEIPFLQMHANRRLPENYQPVDLASSEVFIADDEGVVAGFVAAHLGWQIEPLQLMPEFLRYAPAHGRRIATYKLGKAIIEHLQDPAKNRGHQGFFAHVDDETFRELATQKPFLLHQAYEAGVILKGGFR